jgi:hypothetical protein
MEISIKKWISLMISFKYLSNFAIITGILAYYTQAYTWFFFMIPMIITNFIVMCYLEWCDSDTLTKAILNINENNSELKYKFIFLNTIWHLIPILWIWYILKKDNIIELFRPNFMGSILAGITIALIYFYFASNGKYYGDINYVSYLMIYIIVLFGSNILVFY